MNITFEATIGKGKPMPCICEICQSVKALPAGERDTVQPEMNSCFEPESWVHDYQPFANTKRRVKVTCNHFSHIRRRVYK